VTYAPNKKKLDAHAVLVYSLLFFGAFLLLIPFYWMLSNSLKTEAEASKVPPTLLPLASYVDIEGEPLEVSLGEVNEAQGTVTVTIKAGDAHPRTGETLTVAQSEVERRFTPRWANYPASLKRMNFTDALANTTVITVLCVIGQILSSSLVGFGFARFRRTLPHREAVHETIAHEGAALITTSSVLLCGFSVLLLASFLPTCHFGLLTGVAIAAALLGDLVVLPGLLLLFPRLAPAPAQPRAPFELEPPPEPPTSAA